MARRFNRPNAPLSEGEALAVVVLVLPGNPHWTRVGTDCRLLWSKAPWGAGIACPPPSHAASWRHTGGGGGGGSDPGLFGAGTPPGRGRWCTPKSTTSPPRFGVAPSTVVPGGKAIERCRGQGGSTGRSGFPQAAGPAVPERESGPGGGLGYSDTLQNL